MNEDHYIELLIKKWKGTISPKDLEELNNWLNSSQKNIELAEEFQHSWELSNNYNLPFELDHDKAFEHVLQKIHTKESSENSNKTISLRQRLFTPLSIAASLLLISIITWWTLSYNRNITIVSSNIVKEISLPDGSKVWLNKAGKLSFPKSFDDDKRIVKLTGEAFFEVKRDTTKPFVVNTSKSLVTVLGTSFNVKADNDNVFVTVRTGKVKLESIKSKNSVVLTPKTKGVLSVHADSLSVIDDINLNSLAWKRQMIVFNDTPLAEMIKDLESYYNVEIQLENIKLENCPFTGKYNSNKTIDEILSDLQQIFKMNRIIKVSNGKYLLKGGNCNNHY